MHQRKNNEQYRMLNHDKSQPIIGVVVPFRDEEQCLPILLQSLRFNLESCVASWEIILIDDGSVDHGWQIICQKSETDSRIKGIKLNRGFGKESAVRAGLAAVSAKAAIVMDADMQHPPDLIPEMVRIWDEKKAQVIEAIKKRPSGRNFLLRFSSSILYFFLKKFTNLEFENRSDFKLIDRQVIDRINSLPERITFFRGIVTWFGFPTHKIHFEVKDRVAGKPSWSPLGLTRLAIDAITGFTTAPLRFVTACSAIFIAAAFILIIQTLYMRLSGLAVEGFTTAIICTLMVGAIIAFGLGIIGEYLARIYEEIKQRPHFIIEKTLNIDQKSFD